MSDFINFVWLHKYELAELVLLVIVTCVTIFKKKVKVCDVFESVLMVLPDFIKLAEAEFQSGSEKYSYVFNKCIDFLMNLTRKDKKYVLDTYTSMIDSAIESILSTPQKKER